MSAGTPWSLRCYISTSSARLRSHLFLFPRQRRRLRISPRKQARQRNRLVLEGGEGEDTYMANGSNVVRGRPEKNVLVVIKDMALLAVVEGPAVCSRRGKRDCSRSNLLPSCIP